MFLTFLELYIILVFVFCRFAAVRGHFQSVSHLVSLPGKPSLARFSGMCGQCRSTDRHHRTRHFQVSSSRYRSSLGCQHYMDLFHCFPLSKSGGQSEIHVCCLLLILIAQISYINASDWLSGNFDDKSQKKCRYKV